MVQVSFGLRGGAVLARIGGGLFPVCGTISLFAVLYNNLYCGWLIYLILILSNLCILLIPAVRLNLECYCRPCKAHCPLSDCCLALRSRHSRSLSRGCSRPTMPKLEIWPKLLWIRSRKTSQLVRWCSAIRTRKDAMCRTYPISRRSHLQSLARSGAGICLLRVRS